MPLEEALSAGIGTAKGQSVLYWRPCRADRWRIVTGSTDAFALSQTLAVVVAVKACWAPSTYIPELGHRFLRLTLQVCHGKTERAERLR